jgi:hypothetical protein
MGSDLALRCLFICYVKPNPLAFQTLSTTARGSQIFYLASARLAPIVAPASTSFANPAFSYLAVVLVLVSALVISSMGVQLPEGEKTEISLL